MATQMNSRRSPKQALSEEPYLAKVNYKKVFYLFIEWRTSDQAELTTRDPASSVRKNLDRPRFIEENTARPIKTLLLSPGASQRRFELDMMNWVFDQSCKESLLVLYYDGVTDEALCLRPPSAYPGETIQ